MGRNTRAGGNNFENFNKNIVVQSETITPDFSVEDRNRVDGIKSI